MPEKPAYFYPIGKPFWISAIKALAEKQVITQDDSTADNMEAVQAGDRKIDGIIGVPLRGEHGLQGDLLMGNF